MSVFSLHSAVLADYRDFVLGVFYSDRPSGVQIAPDLLAQLEDRQKKMIDFVREHGKITRTDCVKWFKVSAKTATRELSKLVEVGILEKREKGPATHYVLTGT